jgi:hypothetical protein
MAVSILNKFLKQTLNKFSFILSFEPCFINVKSKMTQLLRLSLTSGLIMGTGDVICQTIVNKQELDIMRTCRFALAGFTIHAPFWSYGFKLIDRVPLHYIKSNIGQAFTRSIITQTLSPIYFPLLYTYIGWMEGIPLAEMFEKKGPHIIQTLKTGIIFWPIVNIINFMYIKAIHRVHYVTLMGVGWNTILSYINSKD